MASANRRATEIWVSSVKPGGLGTVLVEMTSVMNSLARSRSTARPANRPWVQTTEADSAPKSFSRSQISMIEPPVAISSSSTIVCLPSTSPTIESTTTLSSASRRLLPAATGRPSSRANWVAFLALPRSGLTTTELRRSVAW